MKYDWRHYLRKVRDAEDAFGEPLPGGASEEELDAYVERIRSKPIQIPDVFFDLYREANGASVDGLSILGINVPDPDKSGRMDVWRLNEYLDGRGDYTILATQDDQFFAVEASTGRCVRLDSGTGEELEEYDGPEGMLTKMLAAKAESLYQMLQEMADADGDDGKAQ